jgi:hypothetical protein
VDVVKNFLVGIYSNLKEKAGEEFFASNNLGNVFAPVIKHL